MQRYLSPRTCSLCSRTLFLTKKSSRSQYASQKSEKLNFGDSALGSHRLFTTPSSTFTFEDISKGKSLCSARNFISLSKPLPLEKNQRYVHTSSTLSNDSKDGPIDFSKDPEVKKWLSELQSDFEKEIEKNKEDEKNDEKGNGKKDESMEDPAKSKQAADAKTGSKSETSWIQYATQKYEKFNPGKSQIIYDYDEEQRRLEEGIIEEEEEVEELVLERGKTGVFDVEELVDFLREENAKDIAVIQVPPEIKYVSYMVIASSLSQRHINALAETTRRIYKKKKNKGDPSIICEGKSTDWVALDMGNIALHIMKPNIREEYDLETLWTVGAQFDDKCQAFDKDPMDILSTIGNFPSMKASPPDLRS